MRILIVSDVHANPWALAAVERDAKPFDQIIFAGDAVNYGPAPRETVAWLREHQVIGVRGNHDHAIAYGANPRVSPAKERLAQAMCDWTRRQLSEQDISWLARLPLTLTWEYCELKFSIFHATPRDPLFDYHLKPDAGEDLLEELFADIKADVVITGHTHLPFLRQYRHLHLINPGSVGQSLDGDPRAAYALWEDGRLELRRTAYDQAPLLETLGHLPMGPPLIQDLREMIRQGRIVPPIKSIAT